MASDVQVWQGRGSDRADFGGMLGGDEDDDVFVKDLTTLTEVGDERQSDRKGRGLLFSSSLKKGAVLVDDSVVYHDGAVPKHFRPGEYVKYGNGYLALKLPGPRIRPMLPAGYARSFFINEARDGAVANVSWTVVRPTAGKFSFAWKLIHDVHLGEEAGTDGAKKFHQVERTDHVLKKITLSRIRCGLGWPN